jgi:hypothetical protein
MQGAPGLGKWAGGARRSAGLASKHSPLLTDERLGLEERCERHVRLLLELHWQGDFDFLG